jgi:hypothetical protein
MTRTFEAFDPANERHRALLGCYARIHDVIRAEAERMRAIEGEARWADGVDAFASGLDCVGARHLKARAT